MHETVAQKKIAIIGAGPSGMLFALYLLRRQYYKVDIYEARRDLGNSSISASKNYPLILCQRGLIACKQIEKLEEAIKLAGIETEGAVCFNNSKKKFNSPRKKLVSIHRNTLAQTFLNRLESEYSQERFQIHFNCKYIEADFKKKQITFESCNHDISRTNKPTFLTANYDFLIGADGVHSSVRNTCSKAGLLKFEKELTHLRYKTISIGTLKDSTRKALHLGKIYGWRSSEGITLLTSRQKQEGLNCTLFIPQESRSLMQLDNTEAVIDFFRKNFPIISDSITTASAQEFLDRNVVKIWTVYCNQYHAEDSVLLLGDAAHAVSPSIGQGCNSALEDVLVFDSLLDKHKDNWATALPEYSHSRVADAHALRKLADNALPLTKGIFVLFILQLTVCRTLHRLCPHLFSLPFFDLIPNTTTSYSQIYNSAKSWLFIVKHFNQRFLAQVETKMPKLAELVKNEASLNAEDLLNWSILDSQSELSPDFPPPFPEFFNKLTLESRSGMKVNVSVPQGSLVRVNQNHFFPGTFDIGEQLLFTGFNNPGPLVLEFSKDLYGLGLSIQSDPQVSSGTLPPFPFTAIVKALDAQDNSLGKYHVAGLSKIEAGSGATFIGLFQEQGKIAKVSIEVLENAVSIPFAINMLKFQTKSSSLLPVQISVGPTIN